MNEVTTEPGASRADVLHNLQEFLATLLGQTPHVLQTDGAIPVRVTQDQLRQVMRHPLVRAVRTNRQLKTGSFPTGHASITSRQTFGTSGHAVA